MDTFFGGLGAPVMLLIGAFFGVTALLWFLLPFSVFGIKARLDQQIELLRVIERRLQALNENPAATPPDAPRPALTHGASAPGDGSESPAAASSKPNPPTDAPPPPSMSPARDRWQQPGNAAPKDNG